MKNQIEQANRLHNLHIKGDPLIVYNIWDAGSAQALQEIGAKVIATGSWSVAASHGYDNGEKLAFDLVLANLKRIIKSVDLPVTIDLEGGYGQSPEEVKETIMKVIAAGAVGINLEDQVVDGEELYATGDQCRRIKAAREAAEQETIPMFINARTDIFLQPTTTHNDSHVDEALRRAYAYADAGASGFFTPGLSDAKHIEKLCTRSPLPINIMVLPHTPAPQQLAELGVARISYGPSPYEEAMNALKDAGRKALLMGN